MVISNTFLCYNSFRCKIYFYLEDDSIQVIEPKVNNSGIPQGLFLLNWLKGNSHFYCYYKISLPTLCITPGGGGGGGLIY